MGKRSSFKRFKADNYPTIDPRATPPLIPHLRPGSLYSEPCAGAGDLIRQLQAAGFQVQDAMDLEPRAPGIRQGDVFTSDLGRPEQFITNPMWTRKLLHPLIVRLSDIAPTFLLFDSNWANTLQAKPFMERCRKIIAVGRLIWIPGTKMTGKEDCSWYEFGRPIAGSAPLFYGRNCLPAERRRSRRICADCGGKIDRFGKWGLVERNGVATPVHTDCEHPSGAPEGEAAATPLLDWPGYAAD